MTHDGELKSFEDDRKWTKNVEAGFGVLAVAFFLFYLLSASGLVYYLTKEKNSKPSLELIYVFRSIHVAASVTLLLGVLLITMRNKYQAFWMASPLRITSVICLLRSCVHFYILVEGISVQPGVADLVMHLSNLTLLVLLACFSLKVSNTFRGAIHGNLKAAITLFALLNLIHFMMLIELSSMSRYEARKALPHIFWWNTLIQMHFVWFGCIFWCLAQALGKRWRKSRKSVYQAS